MCSTPCVRPSLGATLYCLLTGKAPLEADDIGSILRNVRKGRVPSPRKRDPSLDRAIEAVCLKAMAGKPEDRYASCRALAEDVERWAADESVLAWREPFAVRAGRWMRRNRTAVALAGAVLAYVQLVAVRLYPRVFYELSLREVGRQTRAAIVGAEEAGVGLAYLPAGRAEPGTEIEIDVRGKTREAVVAERPLYRKERDG